MLNAFAFFQLTYHNSIHPLMLLAKKIFSIYNLSQRSTVSTCVILVEGTGQMRILLPVMVVVVIANYVAHLIHKDGIYEVLMKLKGYPYLDHSKDDCYDVFLVRDIMSSPPVTVREKERALHLVQLLRKTSYNGFPVVDEHGRFKGLVRRKQIVALMECGIFEKVGPGEDSLRKSIFESTSSVRSNSGGNNQGLMHYAYHIKDDRYEYIVEVGEEVGEDEEMTPIAPPQEVSEMEKRSLGSKWNLVRSALKIKMVVNENKRLLGGDIAMPVVDVSKIDSSNFIRDDDSDAGIDGGGDDIDSDDEDLSQISYYKTKKNDSSFDHTSMKDSLFLPKSVMEAPKGFARVGRDRKNNVVVISWLNPDYKDDVIDLEAVMNRGTYIVPEHFPLSKAYSLFTLLGLRWIVVVGGIDSGTVVGILTRESFLESYLKLKTGVDPRAFQ
jgi:CBS domain-containing protein